MADTLSDIYRVGVISCRPAMSRTLQNHGVEFRKCGDELAEVKKGEGVESGTLSDIYRISVISCRPAASSLPAGCLAGTLQNNGVEFRKCGDELAEVTRREALRCFFPSAVSWDSLRI
jgi:hypothetical protein